MGKYVWVRVIVQPALGRGLGQRTTDSSHTVTLRSGNREVSHSVSLSGKTPQPLEPFKWDDCIYENKDAYIYIKSGKNVYYL